jgi:archaellum component FlaC
MGAAATAAGSGLQILAPYLAKTTLTLSTLIPYLGLAIAAIGAFAAAWQVVKNNSPEGKLEAAAKATNQATEAAENAAQSYEHLNNSLESIANKENIIKNMTKGTSEWKAAVVDLNNEVMNLIDEYPELANSVTY